MIGTWYNNDAKSKDKRNEVARTRPFIFYRIKRNTNRGWYPLIVDLMSNVSNNSVSRKCPRWFVPNCISKPSTVVWFEHIMTPKEINTLGNITSIIVRFYEVLVKFKLTCIVDKIINLCVALEKLTNTSSNGFHRRQITMNNSQESAIADLKVTTTLLNLKIIQYQFN